MTAVTAARKMAKAAKKKKSAKRRRLIAEENKHVKSINDACIRTSTCHTHVAHCTLSLSAWAGRWPLYTSFFCNAKRSGSLLPFAVENVTWAVTCDTILLGEGRR